MRVVIAVIDLFTLLVFVAVVTSWIRLSEDNPIRKLLRIAVEPVLEPIRRLLPSFGGLDFTPMLVIFALQGVKRTLLGM